MLSGANQLVGLVQGLLSSKKSQPQNNVQENSNISNPNTTNPQQDLFTLSPSGLRTQQFLNSEMYGSDANGSGGELDLAAIGNLKQRGEMLSQMLQVKLQSFQSDFMQKMNAAGVDTSKPIDLQKNDAGNLLVANDHPDKAQIDQILAENPEFAGKFQELSKTAAMSQALLAAAADKSSNPFSSIASLYAKQSQDTNQSKSAGTQFQLQINETAATYSFN
ncbi:MAG: hypothetical protein ACRC2T_05115 [Thermoguttaceae bacterium]